MEITELKRNANYNLGNIPDAKVLIYENGNNQIQISVTIRDVLLCESTSDISEDDIIGIYRGVVYRFKDKGIESWTIDDLTPIFTIPSNVSEIAYKVFDCRNCIASGCYSLDFAVDYFSDLLDISPAIFKSMLVGIKG